jgi:hypothetical protein
MVKTSGRSVIPIPDQGDIKAAKFEATQAYITYVEEPKTSQRR